MQKITSFFARAFFVTSWLSAFSHGATLDGFDLGELEKTLEGPGLPGLVHGVVPERHQVVVRYADPQNPIHTLNFPLLGKTTALKAELEKLRRNDRVVLHGHFKGLDTPIPHLEITAFEVTKKWDWANIPSTPIPTTLAEEIAKEPALIGKVHGVVDSGHILLFDYKDQIFPLIVTDNKATVALWTNDKIRVRVTVQPYPKLPTHLVLDESKADAIQVLEKMSDLKGQTKTLKGALAHYPKSVLAIESWAVQTVDEHGVREFNFVLSEDEATSAKIVEQLSQAWKEGVANAKAYRSREINDHIQLEVTGASVNQVGAGNPQIYIKSIDALKITKH